VPVVRPASLPVLLQVGAFSERQRAEAVAATLLDGGVDLTTVESAYTASGRVWRVRVGPLSDLEQVFGSVDQITALGFERPRYVYP